MCKKAKVESKVLKDRTKGLDSRGNHAMNTQAESNWATDTLKDLSTNQETVTLITDELKRVYDDSKKMNYVKQKVVGSFQKGFEDYFGEYKEDPKTKQMRMVKPPKAQAKPEDLVNLMLEDKYNFKLAADLLASEEKGKPEGRELYKQGRGEVGEFNDRGRVEGRKRRNSFIGPHAGISDSVFRPEGSDNFFTREMPHAKGVLEGDPQSLTYNRFVKQGAPFIGGVSGTIQGVAMCWEVKQKLAEIDDVAERDTERTRREKTMGVYMATLVAGGHHSMAEMLFASQQHGLFPDVPNPLDNYPGAMKALGDRFVTLGMKGGLQPKAGATWRKALEKAYEDIAEVRKEMGVILAHEPDLQNRALTAFDTIFHDGFSHVFTDDLARKLEELVSFVGEDDSDNREDAKVAAADLIKTARASLDDDVVKGLEANPFMPVSVRQTLSSALDQVSSLTN